MEAIESFEVDHDKLNVGLYISRIDGKNRDIVTYDLRMTRPNAEPCLNAAGAHSFEHLFAFFVRNCQHKNNIIYVGQMGCLTGFYFIVQDVAAAQVIEMTKAALQYTAAFEGEIPGSKKTECGNYAMHNLEEAKEYASKMLAALRSWDVDKLKYSE